MTNYNRQHNQQPLRCRTKPIPHAFSSPRNAPTFQPIASSYFCLFIDSHIVYIYTHVDGRGRAMAHRVHAPPHFIHNKHVKNM